jgi:hypothetical protein
VLRSLHCPGLRQLRLQGLKLQLGSADGWPGVLGVCTTLTALGLQSCLLIDAPAASAAIAALPELRQLSLDDNWDAQALRQLYVASSAAPYCPDPAQPGVA